MKILWVVFMAVVTALLVIVGVVYAMTLTQEGVQEQPVATLISMASFVGAAMSSILTVEIAYRYTKHGEPFGFSQAGLESWTPLAIIALLLAAIWVIGAVLNYSAIISFPLILFLPAAFLVAIGVWALSRRLLRKRQS
jgi:uncharacterized membrane protein